MNENKKTVKKLIKEAYLVMLTKKHYKNISVTDLTNTAKVSRISFYRNFLSFENLIEEIINDMSLKTKNELSKFFLETEKDKRIQVLADFYTFFKKSSKSFTKILPENSSYLLSVAEKKVQFDDNKDFNNIEDKYLPVIIISSIMSVGRKWINTDFQEKEEDLARLIVDCIKKPADKQRV